MSDLRQAAQAVVDRWDSPLWKNGSTADAIADLRAALEEAEQRRAEFSEATQRNKDHAEWYLKTHPQQAESDRQALQAAGTHPAPCARHCEAKAFEIEIRSLESRLKQQAEPVAAAPALIEALDHIAKTIERQIELIKDRAPGVYLDKRPVVKSLQSHAKRARDAIAKAIGTAT